MISNKIGFYREIIKKTHDAFREFLLHLPEEILDWKIYEHTQTIRWLIQHVVHDQMWIANVIMDNEEEGYHFTKNSEELALEDFIDGYDDTVSTIETRLERLSEEDLDKKRSYKEYSMTVEDWLFEYIHHLNLHSGEIGFTLTAWKRKNRSLEK
ncbi:MAG: DinB family protein [Candidatus Heimdallarchaeota archaeon]|nr:DinB family protein [Candidatus Heimdallarchaeota archaeon]MCK4954138.1 DinB family protein [Candidatus Heimdallarchaeota archaeon]